MIPCASDSLPRFTRPPLIETVLGVQFEPLPRLGSAQLGVFWKKLGANWPSVADMPALQPQFERFGESQGWEAPGLQISVSPLMSTRLQIRNAQGDRLIQAQNGRLLYNWLGQEGQHYPEYREVRPAFDQALEAFRQFLWKERPSDLQPNQWDFRPNQWEVTYVNHLPKGSVWNRLADCAELFRLRPLLETAPGGTTQESFGGEWHYEIPSKRGRLHAQLQHARLRSPESAEVLILNLTARGPIGENKGELDLDQGLNLGHEVVVRAFYDLTSESAHNYWGLIRGST